MPKIAEILFREPSAVLPRHIRALWLGFLLVHAVLWVEGLAVPLTGGDVDVYGGWTAGMLIGALPWGGLQAQWVYPYPALLPMLATQLLHHSLGSWSMLSVWLLLVTIMHALFFMIALRCAVHLPRLVPALWAWLVFLVILGPIGTERIDTFSTGLALFGTLLWVRGPRDADTATRRSARHFLQKDILLAIAGVALMTLGAWTKVWPAAIIAAAFFAGSAIPGLRRIWIAVSAAATTAVVIVFGLLSGGTLANIFGFFGLQSQRGIEAEAVVATPYAFGAVAGLPGFKFTYDDMLGVLEARGHGSDIASALVSGLLVLSLVVVAVLTWSARHRGMPALQVFAVSALAFTMSLLVFNKVQSAQYPGWLAVPLLAMVVAQVPGWRWASGAMLAVAALTHLDYPYTLVELANRSFVSWVSITDLAIRNILEVALLVYAIRALARRCRNNPQDR